MGGEGRREEKERGNTAETGHKIGQRKREWGGEDKKREKGKKERK